MLDELKQLDQLIVSDEEEELINIGAPEETEVKAEEPVEETEELIDITEVNEDTEEVTPEKEVIDIVEEEQEESVEEEEPNLTAYARVLNAHGRLDDFNEEEFNKLSVDEQTEFFAKKDEEKIYNEAEGLLSGYVDSLPPDMKWMLENYRDGVSWEKILEAKQDDAKYGNLSEEDLLDDEAAMKDMIIDYQIQNGIDEDVAQATADGLADLSIMAKKVYPKMKALKDNKISAAKVQAEKQSAEETKRIATIKTTYSEYIDKMDEVIPGITIPKAIREQVKEYTLKPTKIVDGRQVYYADELRAKDPVKFDTAINYILTLTNGLTDYSSIINKATTKATKSIVADVLSREANKKSTKQNIASNKVSKALESLRKNKF